MKKYVYVLCALALLCMGCRTTREKCPAYGTSTKTPSSFSTMGFFQCYTTAMGKIDALMKLHEQWQEKCTCQLRYEATQAVIGDGNPEAKIVFIGEAPGKNEDREGKPFIGAAGKFLSEMLETIGLKRNNVYITNIVKYRPPNNREPLPEEIEACKEWLSDELTLIKPKLIVFLGRHAMNHFFPDKKISKVHGTLLIKTLPNLGKQHFFALYHPAAALYNGSLREILKKDFSKIPFHLKKIAT